MYPELLIQVDGGIGPANIETVAKAGANVIVAGSSIFGSNDPAKTMQEMRAVINN